MDISEDGKRLGGTKEALDRFGGLNRKRKGLRVGRYLTPFPIIVETVFFAIFFPELLQFFTFGLGCYAETSCRQDRCVY
jgi:hypothetical protein